MSLNKNFAKSMRKRRKPIKTMDHVRAGRDLSKGFCVLLFPGIRRVSVVLVVLAFGSDRFSEARRTFIEGVGVLLPVGVCACRMCVVCCCTCLLVGVVSVVVALVWCSERVVCSAAVPTLLNRPVLFSSLPSSSRAPLPAAAPAARPSFLLLVARTLAGLSASSSLVGVLYRSE